MIIIFWALLVTLACVTLLGAFWIGKGFVPYNASIAETVACMPPTTTMNYAAAQSPYWPTPSPRFHVFTEWISDNGCMDPCTRGPFYWPPAIFRSPSDLQTLSHKETQNLIQVIYGLGFYTTYAKICSITGFFVLYQGLWAICFGPRNPRQCRDVIYKSSMNAKMSILNSHQQDGLLSRYGERLRKKTAKIWQFLPMYGPSSRV